MPCFPVPLLAAPAESPAKRASKLIDSDYFWGNAIDGSVRITHRQACQEINKFYHSRNIKRKAERDHSREVTTQNSHGHVLRKKSYTRSRGEGSCWGEEVCFQLVPWKGGLGPLKKSYLRTSGQLRTIHIVKYIVKKLNLGCNSELEILCNGEVVGKEHNLTFLKRSRWHQNEHLTLHYRSTKKIL